MLPLSPIEVTRRRFLHNVERLAPEVLGDLSKTVYPAYRKLFSGDELSTAHLVQARRFIWEEFEANEDSPLETHQQFLGVLGTWAEKYHLREPWVFNTSLLTMAYWLTFERYSRRAFPTDLTWMFPGISMLQRDPDVLSILFDGDFDLERHPGESGDQCNSRIVKELKNASRIYKNTINNWDQAIRGTDLPRQPKNYEWLVHFQVRGFSPEKIAKKYECESRSYQRKPEPSKTIHLSATVVREAVHRLANAIELTLRPGLKRGRQ